jgi:hypothetical protein
LFGRPYLCHFAIGPAVAEFLRTELGKGLGN